MASFKVNGREYEVPERFTLGELADMEKITGQGYDLGQGGILGTLALMAVAIRRVDPAVTLDEIRALDSTEVAAIWAAVKAQLEAEPSPPAETGSGNGSSPPRSEPGTSDDSGQPPALTLAASGGQT